MTEVEAIQALSILVQQGIETLSVVAGLLVANILAVTWKG